MSDGNLYHLVPVEPWGKCKASGEAYFPPTYTQDGFIHLTKDPSLLLTVANHFYTDVTGDYVVLSLDPSKLTAEVKFEPAADVGNKTSAGLTEPEGGSASADEPKEVLLFPHLYGTIDFESVVAELAVTRGEGGAFLSIAGIP